MMKLEGLNKDKREIKHREGINKEGIFELEEDRRQLENLRNIHPELDSEIRKNIDIIRFNTDSQGEKLQIEKNKLEQEKAVIKDTAQKAIDGLQMSKKRLETLKNNEYYYKTAYAIRMMTGAIESYKKVIRDLDGWDADSDNVDTFSAIVKNAESGMLRAGLQMETSSVLINISETDFEAIEDYTSGGYAEMNQILRKPGYLDRYGKQEKIDALHQLLSHSRTSQPMTTYRSVESRTIMIDKGRESVSLNKYKNEELVGKIITDAAFVSTSLSEEGTIPNRDTMLVLKTPEGSRGLYIGDISSAGEHEEEFLMDCMQQIRIERAEHKNNMRYIYATVLKTCD